MALLHYFQWHKTFLSPNSLQPFSMHDAVNVGLSDESILSIRLRSENKWNDAAFQKPHLIIAHYCLGSKPEKAMISGAEEFATMAETTSAGMGSERICLQENWIRRRQ